MSNTPIPPADSCSEAAELPASPGIRVPAVLARPQQDERGPLRPAEPRALPLLRAAADLLSEPADQVGARAARTGQRATYVNTQQLITSYWYALLTLIDVDVNVYVFSGSGAEVDHAALGLLVVRGLRLCVHRKVHPCQRGLGCGDRQQPDKRQPRTGMRSHDHVPISTT